MNIHWKIEFFVRMYGKTRIYILQYENPINFCLESLSKYFLHILDH